MSDFVQKVRQKVAENPSVMLMTLAVELGRPEGDLVAALPEDMRVQGRKEDFAAIWGAMTQWEKCTFLAVNNGCVVEVEGRLPKGTFGHGMFNLAHGENALSGHIFADRVEKVWFVSKPFFNKESHSVQFFDAKGEMICAVYLGRDGKREIIPAIKASFMNMRESFAQ